MPTADAAARVREMSWYHTIELGDGLVTDGWFDNRPHVHHYGLPERMDGMRVLDIGTWDGFWAFEMERRGAEVVALDVEHESEYDWPPRRRPEEYADSHRGDGFRLAKEILGSKVERVHCNIYEATPGELGTFDLVFCGVVLIHLRDQLLALERFANLCHGRFIFAEEYDRADRPAAVPGRRATSPTATRPWSSGCRRARRGSGCCGRRASTTCGSTAASSRRSAPPGGKQISIPHVVLHAKGRAPATAPPAQLG